MADFRSNSYSYTDRDRQIERHQSYNGGFDPKMTDFRSYSVSYASSYKTNLDIVVAGTNNDFKLKREKSTTSKSWSFRDPEFQRKKRVAGYKVYTVEGKLKGPFKKSFRWIKDKYLQVVYG